MGKTIHLPAARFRSLAGLLRESGIATQSPRNVALNRLLESRHRGTAVDPLAHHLTLRLRIERDLARTPAQRRLLARVLLDVARPYPLLAFRWADTHGHVLAAVDRRDAGELARRIEISLQRALDPGVSFAPAHIKPVMDLNHLKSAFPYVLRQDEHHGFTHDRFHEASNLPDLLGARVLGVWTARPVREYFPRLERADLLAIARWTVNEDPPLDGLPEAAAAAVGLADLSSNCAEATAARRAAVHVGADLASTELAHLLGLSRQAVQRLRGRTTDPAVVRAIRLQLAVRAPGRVPLVAGPAIPLVSA